MNSSRKERLTKITFILNGTLFLLGGVAVIDEGNLALGLFQLFTSLLNYVMLIRFSNTRIRQGFEYAMYIMNIVIALLVAFEYIKMGKSYIQYAWILAAILSAFAFIVHVRKKKD
ncbi:MAG: hypothetical protein ACFHWX_02690 [Bacteroidota bacterium]